MSNNHFREYANKRILLFYLAFNRVCIKNDALQLISMSIPLTCKRIESCTNRRRILNEPWRYSAYEIISIQSALQSV
jgi:hypothetical protein